MPARCSAAPTALPPRPSFPCEPGASMHIKRIVLNGFKSYKNTTVDLCPGTNVVGPSSPWGPRRPLCPQRAPPPRCGARAPQHVHRLPVEQRHGAHDCEARNAAPIACAIVCERESEHEVRAE